jgi:integrase
MHQARKLYLDFRDHRQVRRRIPVERCRTEKQAERFGQMIESLVVARHYGQRPDRGLADWLHGLPKSTLRKLAEIGLIDGEYVTATIPLSQHVADFAKWLTTTKARHGFARSPVYVHNTTTQVEYIIDACGFRLWTDVTKAAVETCLGKLDVASKTFNAYQASFKLFGDWMVENGRAALSPVKGIKPVRWTRKSQRRALTQEEATCLLRAASLGPAYYGMSGVERGVLYLTALETGYRLNELRCLTVGCFDLDEATVCLGAEHTKNHMEAIQLIKRSRAEQYRTFLAGRAPDGSVFSMPGDNEVLAAFREDLKAAGIKSVDDRGVKVTFHSLRYGLASALDRTRATLKERMTILRHSDKGNLTLGTYTTLEAVDLRGAVERLPDYPWPPAIKQAAEQQPEARKEVA